MESDVRYAALFVDYENLYYFLKNRLTPGQDPGDAVTRMVRSARIRLQQTFNEQCVIQHAYGDFEKIDANAQSDLYLLGVDTHHVLGTEHKNAADMRLCIDALEVLYTRPEIRSFVFMAGDRDYIPVIQHLRKHARTIRVAAFPQNISGDLLQIVGEDLFIDGTLLLPSEFVLGPERRPSMPAPQPRVDPVQTAQPRPVVPRFNSVRRLTEQDRAALDIMLRYFGDKPEVWVTPYLRRLREEMPMLEEYERKALLSNLSHAGATTVEKRTGTMNDYSVAIINWDHPDVRDLNPGGGE